MLPQIKYYFRHPPKGVISIIFSLIMSELILFVVSKRLLFNMPLKFSYFTISGSTNLFIMSYLILSILVFIPILFLELSIRHLRQAIKDKHKSAFILSIIGIIFSLSPFIIIAVIIRYIITRSVM